MPGGGLQDHLGAADIGDNGAHLALNNAAHSHRRREVNNTGAAIAGLIDQ